MIAIKLIFQSLVGVAAVGTAVAGGYKIMNTEADNFEFEYLLVNSGTLPTTNQDTTPLTIDEAKKKNYQCKSVKQDLDVSCEIFKTSSEATPASLDLEKLNSNVLLVKESIKESTNYVLKVKKSFSELQSISLVTNDSTKTFATLTTKYKLGSDLTNVKTNLIIVQSINLSSASSSITNTTGTFKCLIEGSQEKIDCDFYKPTTAKTDNDFSSTDFSSIALIANASEVKENNFFVLDLKTNKFSKEQFRNKKISLTHVATGGTATVTKISDLIFDQAVVGNLTPEANKFLFPIAPSNEVYYVAQTIPAIEDSKLPDLELFTPKAESASSSKNFKCQLSGQTGTDKTDISCQMFSLSAFDGTKKSVLFDSLKTSNTEITTKAGLTAAKYLKLKINTAHMSSLNWTSNAETTIDIMSKVTPADATKPKYASLKLLAKEEKEKLLGKTQFVVAKASANFTPSVTGSLTLKCKVGSEQTASECDVYKFSSQPTETTTPYKVLSFASITKVSASTDITANHLYLVDLKTPAKYEIKIDSSKQVITVTNTSESSPTFNFNVESPLLGHLETAATSGNFIFLK